MINIFVFLNTQIGDGLFIVNAKLCIKTDFAKCILKKFYYHFLFIFIFHFCGANVQIKKQTTKYNKFKIKNRGSTITVDPPLIVFTGTFASFLRNEAQARAEPRTRSRGRIARVNASETATGAVTRIAANEKTTQVFTAARYMRVRIIAEVPFATAVIRV